MLVKPSSAGRTTRRASGHAIALMGYHSTESRSPKGFGRPSARTGARSGDIPGEQSVSRCRPRCCSG